MTIQWSNLKWWHFLIWWYSWTWYTLRYADTPQIWWLSLKWSIWQKNRKKCHAQDLLPGDKVWHSMTPDATSWHLIRHHDTWCANSNTWCTIICMDGVNAMSFMVEGSRSNCMTNYDWLTHFIGLCTNELDPLGF